MSEFRKKEDIFKMIECQECDSNNLIYADELLRNNEIVCVPLADISNVEDRFRFMCDMVNEPYTISKEKLFEIIKGLLE